MASVQQVRRMRKVEIVDDERDIGNGLIVTLRKGFSFDPFCDNRVAGADNATEAVHLVNSARTYHGPYDE